MGNRTRARKASCRRPRRLTKPRPAPTASSSSSPGPSRGRPSRRAPIPAGTGAPRRRRSRGCAGSHGPVRRRQPTSSRWWYHSVACSMASRKILRRLAVPAGVGVLADGDPGLVGQAAHRIDEVEVLDGPDEADGVALGLAPEAVVEALLGVDAERRRLLAVERAQADPAAALLSSARRARRSRATMSVAARTRATSSSGMPMDDDGTACQPRRQPCRRLARRLRSGLPRDGLGLGRFAAAGRLRCRPVWPASTAWAAASRAIGTRKGEQLT